MKRRMLVGLVVALNLANIFAQSADAPPSHEDIIALFTLMHVREQVNVALDAIAKQQRTIVHDNLKRQSPRISPRDLARLDQFTAEILKDMPVEDMLEDMVPVYQRHLSKSDVDAMSAFYSSPVGQKLLREMPAMTIESMQAASPRIQAFMDKVMERAEAMAKDRNGQGNKNATKEGSDN